MNADKSAEQQPGLRVKAHAKINLYLRVLAREASGFHSIETIFQKIALHDEVRVSLARDRALSIDGPALQGVAHPFGKSEDNLAWRAAALYMQHTAVDAGFHIDITKNIPVGGGLGGGSADAAAVLNALNVLSPKPIPAAELLDLGAQLGSDVPFLLTGWSRALAWGRGTRMLELSPLPTAKVTLFTFDEGVNTAHAYTSLAESRTGREIGPRSLAINMETMTSWDGMASIAHNDFEPVVSEQHEGVRDTLAAIRLVGRIAMMSGSGATCFVVHGDKRFAIPNVSGANRVETETV